MVRTFTEATLGARSTAVPPNHSIRYHLTLTPQIKSIISQKNERRRAWQRHHNTDDRDEFGVLNNMYGGLRDKFFWQQTTCLEAGS
jgi:hypothetical protein